MGGNILCMAERTLKPSRWHSCNETFSKLAESALIEGVSSMSIW